MNNSSADILLIIIIFMLLMVILELFGLHVDLVSLASSVSP